MTKLIAYGHSEEVLRSGSGNIKKTEKQKQLLTERRRTQTMYTMYIHKMTIWLNFIPKVDFVLLIINPDESMNLFINLQTFTLFV